MTTALPDRATLPASACKLLSSDYCSLFITRQRVHRSLVYARLQAAACSPFETKGLNDMKFQPLVTDQSCLFMRTSLRSKSVCKCAIKPSGQFLWPVCCTYDSPESSGSWHITWASSIVAMDRLWHHVGIQSQRA